MTLLFCVALALRLVYLYEVRDVPFVEVPINDAREYDQWARTIAAGDWWGSETFYQAPAYPYFLALVYAVTGPDLWIVRILQMVLGAASCVVLAVATRQIFDARVALTAGLGLALYPPAIAFDGIVGKMGLGLFLLTSLLALLLAFQRRPHWGRAAAAGVVLALLCLTRENALALAPAILAWLALRFRAVERAALLGWLGAFVLGLGIVLGAVGVRNYVVGESFVVTTSQMGTNFYIGNNPNATGLYAPLRPGRNTPTFEASDAANLAEAAVGRPLSRGEVSDYWLGEGLRFVREQPLDFALLFAAKCLYTWNAFEIADTEDLYLYADSSRVLRWLLPVVHFGVLAPLATAGAVLAWRRRRDFWLLPWLAVSYTAAVALFIAFARFRYPLVPMLMPLAAFAVVEALRCVGARDFGRLALPGATALLAAAVTNAELLDEEALRATSYVNAAGVMLNQRREAEAIPYLERAEALQSESADLHFHFAVLHYRARELEDAEQRLRRMLAIAPDDFRGFRLLAATLEAQGREEEARAAARKARELNPDLGVRHPPKANRPAVVPRPEGADPARPPFQRDAPRDGDEDDSGG